MPFFVIKSALFVQANVAVNTKLTSKVPFFRPAKVPAFRVKVTHSAFVPAVPQGRGKTRKRNGTDRRNRNGGTGKAETE